MSPRYEERLAARIRAADSRLCVGLDPRPDRIDGPVEDFVRRVIDETAPSVAAYKPNAAYFEALGLPGLRLLEQLRGWIPDDIPLILDGKRGDIPETNRAYARACFDVWGADAVTVNPWPGFDSLEPLPLLAVAVFVFHAKALMLATEADHVHHVLADPSELKVVPLLQAFLFDDEFCAAAG